MPRIDEDERGLAIGIIGFVAVIVASALLYTILEPAAGDIFSMSLSQTSDSRATTAINRREEIFGYSLLFALFLGGVGLLARSVFESRGPGL